MTNDTEPNTVSSHRLTAYELHSVWN